MIRKQKEKWSGDFVPVVTTFNDDGKINNESITRTWKNTN